MNIVRNIIISFALWPALLFSQTNFYVSGKGNEDNPGTKTRPFASIKRALTEARKTPGNVTIYLSGGTYFLEQPVVFTSEDSRKENESLTLTNFDNQEVTVSGGVLLNLKWEPERNGIWRARVEQDLIFDELFVNGQLQRMARYPNFDLSARFLGGTAADAVSKERSSGWKAPKGGYVHALHRYEWGDFHYIITGKDDNGELVLEGGWQNNRRMGMHPKYRFVENIYEELDTVNEWFYNKSAKILYYYPPAGLDIELAKFETPQITHLFEFKGSETNQVRNINISGLMLTQTLRTFMQNKEPLLRSDWTIYRGGAVVYEGAVNCALVNCSLVNLGGNAIFFNNFNRYCEVSGCQISDIGASAICFVGDPNAVRSPSFEYSKFVPFARIDTVPGPKTNNYPAECKVYNNLMFNLGLTEKQSTAVELSMCQSILVSHNTIYDVPRAGINISEGTWGGHIIEFNDVFNTVKESGDHGSFNSWGRDRYWHPNKRILDTIVENHFNYTMLDVVRTIIVRNNRMKCDHGWDIDLDDGSSNYLIYNNLCLNGGIKLREGVNRVVENNIMINNTFHPHVWFRNSNDVFRHNIVSAGYLPVSIKVWGKEIDHNAFPDSVSLKEAWSRGSDKHSVCGKLLFMDPEKGDFRLKEGAAALSTGFKNFPMDNFGVVSSKLKALAKRVQIPSIISLDKVGKDEIIDFIGAKIKNLNTTGERSATGMDDARGVLVLEVTSRSGASEFLLTNDVILFLNNKKTNNLRDLLEARMSIIGTNSEIIVFRDQKEVKILIEIGDKK
jgi:hypothetical protein